MKIKKQKIILATLFLLILFAVYVFKFANHYPKKIDLKNLNDFFGVTYSKKYAEDIGLDWQETYLAVLDELNVKKIRIPVYWDDIETEPGVFDFSDYNFLIEEGENRGVEFILNLGLRVARWPECHFPPWVNLSDQNYLQDQTLKMLSATMDNFKKYKSITHWQVENEPLLNSFGICPPADYSFLKQEIELVKRLDDRPIIVSATGELSFWRREAKVADVFGTTMYRVVHNPWVGYIKYPYSSNFYKLKARALGLDFENIFIIELQAEPWIPKEDIANIYNTKYQKSFNIDQFKANTHFSLNTGFKRAYFWGVEWWYFKHKLGENSDYWNFAKTLF